MTVLALGPHVDDLEIGCGATLLLLKRYFGAQVHVRVLSQHYTEPVGLSRVKEGEAAAARMGYDSFSFLKHTDTEFPLTWREIQRDIKQLRSEVEPSLVLCPNATDVHQDHATVAVAVAREFRYGETVWTYEIRQFGSTHAFIPNLYVDVGLPSRSRDASFLAAAEGPGSEVRDTLAHEKVEILLDTMATQRDKPLLRREVLTSIMTLRAMQAGPQFEYAEAFSSRMILGSGTQAL